MRLLTAALTLHVLPLIGCPAYAAGRESRDRSVERNASSSREAKERAAKKACLTGDTVKGVEILADLFIDTGDLTYIFNQGRCFEQNRHYDDAVGRFREYLVKGAGLSAEEKADAEHHISVCQSYLGKPEAAPAAPAPAPAITAEPTTLPAAAPVAAPPAASVERAQQRSVASDGSGLRIAGLVTGSVGAAAVVTAVLLTLKVNSMTDDLEKPYNYSRSTDATRRDYKTLVWVSYGVGAACITGGALMYYLGWRKGRGARVEVAFVPAVGLDTAGAVLTGGF